METSSAGRIFRTVCKLVTVAAVTLVLTPGLACQTRRLTQRSEQNWRTMLHAEESPHASARAETLAIDRGGATVVAGSFTGVLRVGRYSIRSVSESAGFVLKIASDGEPQWLARLGTAGLSKRSLALDGAGNAIIAADGYVDRGETTPPHQPFNLTKLSAIDGRVIWRKLDDEGALTIVAVEDSGGIFVAGSRGSAETARWGSKIDGLPPDLRWPFLQARDLHVARYAAEGERRWSHSVTSFPAAQPSVSDLAVLDTGGVAVAGVYNSRLNFGGVSLLAEDGRESFVAALSADGEARWAKSVPMNLERYGAPLLAAVPQGVAFLHSAEPRVAPPPGSTRSDYRVTVFDHAGAQTAAFPVSVDSSQSFFCCFAARSGDAFFVAGGQDGLFLLEMSAGGTQRTRAKWGVEGSPVGLGVAIDRRSIVGASAQPTDATFASYRSVVLRLN